MSPRKREDDFRHPERGPALLAGTAVRDLLSPHRTSPRSEDDDIEECQRGQSSWDALRRAPTKENEDAGRKARRYLGASRRMENVPAGSRRYKKGHDISCPYGVICFGKTFTPSGANSKRTSHSLGTL